MPHRKAKQFSRKNEKEKELGFSIDKIRFFSQQEKKISAALIASDQKLKQEFFPGRILRTAAPAIAQDIYNGDGLSIRSFVNYILFLQIGLYLLYEKYNTPSINWPERIGSILQQFLENDVIKQEESLSIDILKENRPNFFIHSYFILMPLLVLMSFTLNYLVFSKALEGYSKDETDLMPKIQGFIAILGWFNTFRHVMAGRRYLQDDIDRFLSAQQAEIARKANALITVIDEDKTEIVLEKNEKRLFGYIKIFLKKKIEMSYSEAKIGHRNPLDAHDVNKEILFVLRLLGIYGYEIQEDGKNGIKLIGAIGQRKSSLTIEKAMKILRERLVFRENINFYHDSDPAFRTLKDRLHQATHTFWYVSKINRDDKGMLCLSTTANIPEDAQIFFSEVASRCPSIILEEDNTDKTYNIYCVDIVAFSIEMHSYLRIKQQEQKKKGSVSTVTPMRECDVPSNDSIPQSAKKRVKKYADNTPNIPQSSNAEVKRLHTSLRFIGLPEMEKDIRDPIVFKKVTAILATGKMLAPNSQSQQGLKCTLDKERVRVKMKGYGGGLRPLFIFNSEMSEQEDEKVYEYKRLMHK